MNNIDEKIAALRAEVEKMIAALENEVKKAEQPMRFEPKNGDEFVYVEREGTAVRTGWNPWGGNQNKNMTEYNNVFRPLSLNNLCKYAHDVLRVQNRLMQLHEELCPEFLSWDKVYPSKHIVVLDLEKRKWYFDAFSRMSPCIVVFTRDAAEKACEILNAEKFMMSDE